MEINNQQRIPKILSLGGGVQSSCLLYLNIMDKIDIDYAVFADTGAEPEYVYEHLEYLKSISKIPIYTVKAKYDLVQDLERGKLQMPAFVESKSGKSAMLSKHCTTDYKIRPCHKFIRNREGYKRGYIYHIMIGISTDEQRRVHITKPPYMNIYPLIFDIPMSRNDCVLYAKENGFNIPQKSGCICCPYTSKKNAKEIKLSENDLILNSKIETLANNIRPCRLNRYIDIMNQEEEPTTGNLFECSGFCFS